MKMDSKHLGFGTPPFIRDRINFPHLVTINYDHQMVVLFIHRSSTFTLVLQQHYVIKMSLRYLRHSGFGGGGFGIHMIKIIREKRSYRSAHHLYPNKGELVRVS